MSQTGTADALHANLVALFEENCPQQSELLDEHVHEAALADAAATNNAGPSDQIAFIINSLGMEEAAKIVKGLVEEKIVKNVNAPRRYDQCPELISVMEDTGDPQGALLAALSKVLADGCGINGDTVFRWASNHSTVTELQRVAGELIVNCKMMVLARAILQDVPLGEIDERYKNTD